METKLNTKNLIKIKMSKEKIVILILSLIILLGVGIYAYNNITQKAYDQGIQDSVILMNQEIINSLNQNGYVPFSFTQDNQTYQLKLAVMQEGQV